MEEDRAREMGASVGGSLYGRLECGVYEQDLRSDCSIELIAYPFVTSCGLWIDCSY